MGFFALSPVKSNDSTNSPTFFPSRMKKNIDKRTTDSILQRENILLMVMVVVVMDVHKGGDIQ